MHRFQFDRIFTTFFFFSILSVCFVVFFPCTFLHCQNRKTLPRVRFLEKKKKKKIVWSVCNFSKSVAGVFPSTRGVRRRRFPLRLPDLICTSRSTAKDYGQAEAGGNRRPWFPRLCLTAAGKERETLRPSHVQWRLRKKKKEG